MSRPRCASLSVAVLLSAVLIFSCGNPAYAALGRVLLAVPRATAQPAVSAGAAAIERAQGSFSPDPGAGFSLDAVLPSASFSRTEPDRGEAASLTAVAAAPIASGAFKLRHAAPKSLPYPAARSESRKAALGRLKAAASGFIKVRSLSGTSLKNAADVQFDQARSVDSETDGAAISSARVKRAPAPGLSREVAAGAQPEAPASTPPAPKQKISRALRIGALTAVVMLAVNMAAMASAVALGYQFHPSYQMPALSDPATYEFFGFLAPVLAKAQDVFMAGLMAPLNEEVYFRAGVIGVLGWSSYRIVKKTLNFIGTRLKLPDALEPWVAPAAFGVTASYAATGFALLHEISDPVLITTRLIQAALLSYLYIREGLVSGIAHHAVFNGIAIVILPFISIAGVIVVPHAATAAIVLLISAYVLYKMTRKTAAAQAAQMRAGVLAPYRLSAKASSRLGWFSWASVAALAGLAFIQAGTTSAVFLAGMAAQVAPAALAFLAYAFFLKNLELREGPQAAADIRNPKEFFPTSNKIGAWTAGVFASIYGGVLSAVWSFRLVLEHMMLDLLPAVATVAAPALLVWAGLALYRLKRSGKGISPSTYLAQWGALAAAATAIALPWIIPALEAFARWALAADLPTLILPTLSAMVWIVPVFLAMTLVLTWTGKRLMDRAGKTNAGGV